MRIARTETPHPLLLLGTVRGREAEARDVREALDEFRADGIALGLSPEEVRALQEHFNDPHAEPWVPLASGELAYARGLARFGTVRVPSPSHLAALGWARERGVLVQGLEPSDDTYSELFLEHVGYLELLRRTLADRSLKNAPPGAESPEAFAVAWDARTHPGRGSRRLLEARSRLARESVLRLSGGSGGSAAGASLKSRLALVVDVERFSPLLQELQRSRWKGLEERTPASPVRTSSPLRSSSGPP